MKINSINIISFGGLKNYTLDFGSGYNCIYADNEHGKTTVMSFIKMMFYGNERGGAQISKNIRKKYTPWDGSQMAGSIDFEFKGKSYRLEREFRSSNSTDKVSLTDLSLGEKQSVEGDIGVKLFGLTASAFERSIFVGQLGFPESDTAAEGEINARLSNLVSTGDEKISLESVISRLEKARFALISKGGKTGEYNKNLNTATRLQEKLRESVTANRQYAQAKAGLIAHNLETKKLCEKAEKLKVVISKEQDIKNAQNYKELLAAKADLEEEKQKLLLKNGSPADENYIRNLKFIWEKYKTADEKLSSKKKELALVESNLNAMLISPAVGNETPESLQESIEQLNEKLSQAKSQITQTTEKLQLENSKTDFKKRFNPILLILSCIFAITAIISIAGISTIFGITFGLGAVLSLVLSMILKPQDRKMKSLHEEKINNLQDLISQKTALVKDLEEQLNSKKIQFESMRLSLQNNTSVIESLQNQITALNQEIILLNNDRDSIKTKLTDTLSLFNNCEISETESVLEQLKQKCEKQGELKLKINTLLKVLNNISYEEAEKKLKESETETITTDFDAAKHEYDALMTEVTQRKEKEAAGISGLKALISGIEAPNVLEKQLSEITSLLTAQKAFCDSADIAKEVLIESFSELRANFSSSLEKRAGEIFSKLTGGKYSNITVSKSFALNVTEQGALSREAEYLSSGTFDQAYLSLRLSIAQLICDSDTLPLFLDDSLTQYDDTRAKKTVEFLKDFCKDRQLIMFTCHKSIAQFSDY